MSDCVPARVPDHVLDDLGRRLRATRRPTLPRGLGWEHGTDEAYLAELVEYWATAYDWRPHEERIRALRWERAGQLNVVHQRADDAAAPAVVLLHGWPDLVLRFQRVLPLLDEFHVIVPALPGYPFADPLADPGMSATRMADLVAEAVAALGYHHVVVSGGDIGAMVGEALGARHAERLVALHLTDIPFVHLANLGDAFVASATLLRRLNIDVQVPPQRRTAALRHQAAIAIVEAAVQSFANRVARG